MCELCELCKVSECIPGKAICAECHATLEVLDLERLLHVFDEMVMQYYNVLKKLED